MLHGVPLVSALLVSPKPNVSITAVAKPTRLAVERSASNESLRCACRSCARAARNGRYYVLVRDSGEEALPLKIVVLVRVIALFAALSITCITSIIVVAGVSGCVRRRVITRRRASAVSVHVIARRRQPHATLGTSSTRRTARIRAHLLLSVRASHARLRIAMRDLSAGL